MNIVISDLRNLLQTQLLALRSRISTSGVFSLVAIVLAVLSYAVSIQEAEANRRIVFSFELMARPYTGPRGDIVQQVVGFKIHPGNPEMIVNRTELFFDSPLRGYMSETSEPALNTWEKFPPDNLYSLDGMIHEITKVVQAQFDPWQFPDNGAFDWHNETCEGYFPMIIESDYVARSELHNSLALYEVHYIYRNFVSNGRVGRKGVEIVSVVFSRHLSRRERDRFGEYDPSKGNEKCNFRGLIEPLPEGTSTSYSNFPHPPALVPVN